MMWYLIDRQGEDGVGGRKTTAFPATDNRVTYAARLGSIGCLVLVETRTDTQLASSMIFVPGIAIKCTQGIYSLEPVAGYGQVPIAEPPLDEDG